MNYDHLIPHPMVIDDLLPENVIEDILDEFRERTLSQVKSAPNYRYLHFVLNNLQDRSQSAILRAFDNIWTDTRILDTLEKNYNFASHMMAGADVDFTQIKIEGPDDECAWHRNDFARVDGVLSLVTWIYYLKPQDNYTGGELEYSFENIRQKTDGWDPVSEPKETMKIENKHNRFVMIPSFYWHRVHPPKFKYYNSPMDGRLTVNGNVGYNLIDNRSLNSAVWTER